VNSRHRIPLEELSWQESSTMVTQGRLAETPEGDQDALCDAANSVIG